MFTDVTKASKRCPSMFYLIICCFSIFQDCRAQSLSSVSPSIVSAFGGNTLSIVGSGFPAPTVGGLVLCLWQGWLTLGGTYHSATEVECPVPSIFRFIPFSNSAVYSLNNLKIGFDVNSVPTYTVLGGSSPLQISTRAVQDELAPISVNPFMSFATFGNLAVTVSGSGFPVTNSARCQFSLVTGQSVLVPGSVMSSSEVACTAPTLAAIDPGALAPANALVKVSFDGGQTFSSSQAGFVFLPSFQVTSANPSHTISGHIDLSIILKGSNFYNSENLACRFVEQNSGVIVHAVSARYISSSLMECELPSEDSGVYGIQISLDALNYFPTGVSILVDPPPSPGTISPSRGPFNGGTLVTITGSGFVNSASTKCYFGNAPTNMTSFISSTEIQCLSPACEYAIPAFSTDPQGCNGDITVYVVQNSLQGGMNSAPVTLHYTAQQVILGIDPWYASAWDAPLVVRIYGKGFNDPIFFRWLDLDPIQATFVDSNYVGQSSWVISEVDSFADCLTPILPDAYKPAAATGLDWILAFVEVSPNGVDFTSQKTQWIFYYPPIITGFSPDSVLAGSVRTGGVTVSGSHFLEINSLAFSCLWHYESGSFESVQATLIDSSTLFCAPTQPASPALQKIVIEIRSTPGVVSAYNLGLNVIPVPTIASVIANSISAGPYLGGDRLTVSGSGIRQTSDIYVAVGDRPVLASQLFLNGGVEAVQITVPPSYNLGPTPITLVLNYQDRLVLSTSYIYAPVSPGDWYSPFLHEGVPTPCGPGKFCAGGFPSNDSVSDFSVLSPQACVPGTYQAFSSSSSCEICQAPSFCPEFTQAMAYACPENGVCWAKPAGIDAELPTCPIGNLCAIPAEYATLSEIPPPTNPLIPYDYQPAGRRLLQTMNALSYAEACPEGNVCPPNSIVAKIYCSIPGLYCAEGSASPVAVDSIPLPGVYVDSDTYSISDCGVGHYCENGLQALCPPGTYGNTVGLSECSACQGGTVCPSSGLTLPLPCPPGFICSLPGDVHPNYLCPAGAYCLGFVLTMNVAAVDVPSKYLPITCPQGLYCSAGTNAKLPDLTNPSAPRLCAVGFYCGQGQQNYRGSGICPIGYFCVAGSVYPVVAPQGYYVSSPGAYSPTQCEPGTYQDLVGQGGCKACPDGHECPEGGTVVPSLCAAAHYRSNSDNAMGQNINCRPCPEGTWSSLGGLTSANQCQVCPERYVCGMQGMTIFATVDQTDCSNGNICYANSQATSCPEGYACAAGTTSYTQFSYPCEAGYFCKSLTALPEMRYLLCPSGFVCKGATGFSRAYTIPCPAGYFCPEGTAGVENADGTSVSLYNVQALSDIGDENPNTRAVCRICDPHTFIPPDAVSSSSCKPCAYTASYASLKCPDGTTSTAGSVSMADCVQTGTVLAVVNVYKSTEVVANPRANKTTALWTESREWQWVNQSSPGYSSKDSLPYGQPVSSTNSYIVDFLGYDPRSPSNAASEFYFVSVEMNSLDVMLLDFNFTQVPSKMILATSGSTGGNYLLVIDSDKIAQGSSSYLLPYTIDQGSGDLHGELFRFKLTALMDQVNVNISLSLLDGAFYPDMHFFNDAVNLTLISPNRSEAGTANSFYAIIDSDSLISGQYELPYNMIPTLANEPGDLSLVIDLANQTDLAIDTALVQTMIPGTTFWQIAGASTVAMPWLPFFSNCDYFDRHITLWDLIENGAEQLPSSVGQCVVVESDQVRTVAPWVYDFSTGEVAFDPIADFCEIALQCRYEDNLVFSGGSSTPWMAIPSSGTTPLFYLTQDPWSFDSAAAPNFQASLGNFDSQVGSDSLIPVFLQASQRTGNFPRLVSLAVNYAQITTTSKRIVSATLTYSNFDNNSTDPNYLLQISFEPMNWMMLMDNVSLPLPVYVVIYALVGFAIIGCGLVAWTVLKLVKGNTVYPNVNLIEAFTFFMGFPIQGIVVSAIPVFFLVGVVKVLNLPQIGFLKSVPCGWTKGSSSSTSVVLPGTNDYAVCQPMRAGTCLIFAGIFLAWSASFFFTPRLPLAQKEYLEQSGSSQLQDDGIYFPGSQKLRVQIFSTVLTWKRMHMFFMLVLMCLPVMVILYLSYSAMFGNFTIYYVVGYTVTMLIADVLFVKAAREKFGFEALNVVTDVAFFLATFAAVDLNSFVVSFLFAQFFIIAQRLVAELILNYIYEDGIPDFVNWFKSRKFVWNVIIWTARLSKQIRHHHIPHPQEKPVNESGAILDSDSKFLKFSKIKQPYIFVRNHDKLHEFKSLDQSIDQTMGVAARTSSLGFAPLAVIMMWIFADETQFMANYGLRNSDMPAYLLFSFMMIPFQISLEIIINHAFDSSRNMKIFDYMYLSMWRWRNRLTRWMLDDTRLDQSFGESSQALHHLGFSPQFYFIVAYGVAGGIFIIFGITSWIVNGVPGFLDPALPIFIIIMFLAQRVADSITRWLVFFAVWAPGKRAPEKAFVQSIALGLKQRELEQHQVAFRNAFFKQHKKWIFENLEKVYTPRGVSKYRSQLSDLYQRVVNLNVPFLYSAPAVEPPPQIIEKPSDDSPEDFELFMNSKKAQRQSSSSPSGPIHSDLVAPITHSLVMGWFEVARKHVRKARLQRARESGSLGIDTTQLEENADEVFPDWVVITLSTTSRQIMKLWLRKARQNVGTKS